jgi:Zn-dependent protease/predicted transcriptional regulator
MRSSFRLGSLFGISILVHFTWFVIFVLITLSMVGHFTAALPELSVAAQWLVGLTASLLFFGSVVFHELAHSLLAIRYGHPVRAITLFIFGGVSQIESEAKKPSTEIWVALVGPLASFLLAVVFGALWYLSNGTLPVVSGVAGWLAAINVALGIFNLLPGFPLDGGRILRGLIWYKTGNQERATRVAALVGRGFGYLIMVYGAWLSFEYNDLFGGVWLVFIGWFLAGAAGASVRQQAVHDALAGVQAASVMTTDCPFVPSGTSLAGFVEHFLLRSGRRCFIVGEPGRPYGLITLEDVRAVPREEWRNTSVQAALRPLDKLHFVSPETDLEEVLRLMDEHKVAQVPVMQGGQLLGIITRDRLLHLIRNQIELQAA